MTPEDLSAIVLAAVRAGLSAGDFDGTAPDEVAIERPKNPEHGDYATNVALRLAKPAARPAREVAEAIAARLRDAEGIAAVDVAGPGFLNITLVAGALGDLARTIVEQGARFGHGDALAGQNLNLEFVSANPTGPVHLGGARWAAVGDALGRLLEAGGARVTREYYVNDAGSQIERFGRTLREVAHGRAVPDDGYAGAYIEEIAAAVVAERPDVFDQPDDAQVATFGEAGVELMLADIRGSLAAFDVHFDVYFRESELHAKGELAKALERLRAQGSVYEADGATWLRTSDFGDDRDRVLVRGSGEWTYFAADCAYYLDKRDRGFDKVVIMLAADHHGYINRLRAMATCFGDDPDRTLELLIGQLVNLIKDGEPVRISKRAGNVVVLGDLVDVIGHDAARYVLTRYSIEQTIDIDLDLWSRKSSDNPVYYVQYAHARLASLLRNAAELGLDAAAADLGLLTHERESDLLASLGEFPRVIAAAAELRAPHRVAHYLEALAGTYHRFYDACRVLPMGDEPATELTFARLRLCDATRIVLANGLGLLGVSAPERM